MAERIDGSTVAFSSSRRTHIDKQNHITRKDQVLAFRLAAGWEVRGRWQAFQYCVFVNIVQDFEKSFREHGWLGQRDIRSYLQRKIPEKFIVEETAEDMVGTGGSLTVMVTCFLAY